MKVLVVGAGKIGWGAAYDLINRESVDKVGILDKSKIPIAQILERVNSEKIVPYVTDINDIEKTREIMQDYDVGIITMPDRRTSYKTIEAAIAARLNAVDVLEEYHRRPDKYEMEGLELPGGMNPDDYGEWLHDQACKNDITVVDGMGFAPGLSNITVGDGLRKLDHADAAIARVGGIPDKDTSLSHPLCYVITWAFHHVIREYNVKVLIIQDGKVKEVDALTERESFRFEHFGKNFDLEAAITPGMPSFIYTRPNLLKFCEKTIRWPGHWIAIDTLKECGLFDLEPITFNGEQIIPRDFFSALITPRLLPCDADRDICVMYNTVLGTKDDKKIRIDYYMWNEDDQANGLTAMMRATAFPAAGTALLLAKGEIDHKGIVAPEDAIYGSAYRRLLKDLEERNIFIKEVETRGD